MGCTIHFSKIKFGSAQLTGEAPGLQIRCEALKPSRVGSIPMHFRHLTPSYPLSVSSNHGTHLIPKSDQKQLQNNDNCRDRFYALAIIKKPNKIKLNSEK